MCPRTLAVAHASHICLLVLVLVALPSAVTVSTATVPAHSATSADADAGTTAPVESEVKALPLTLQNNTITVALNPSGDTNWTVAWKFNTQSEEDRIQFRKLAEEFERGESDQLQSLSTFQNVSQQLDEERSREIQITGVQRTSDLNESTAVGTLRLSFTWENFAQTNGDELRLGDTLTTEEGGLWLDGLTARQNLVIQIPEGYGVTDANADVRNGALRWDGPTNFEEGTLETTLVGNREISTPTETTQTPEPETPQETSSPPWSFLGVLGIVVVGGLVILALRYREPILGGPHSDHDDSDDHGDDPGEDGADPHAGQAGQSPEINEELLSDEERVERLLEHNGGRMKQADIVEETDWSNAKVSQLLSSMESEDRIDKLRIGRENLISFPDVDITETENEE